MENVPSKKVCLMIALVHQVDDVRVSKIAKSLSGTYDVAILAKSAPGGHSPNRHKGIIPYADDRKFRKCFHALRLTRQLRPDVLHCHDLVSLAVGLLAKLLLNRRSKLIFDVHEFYEKAKHNWASIDAIFVTIVVSLLTLVFGRLIDGFIFVVSEQKSAYARFNKPTVVLPNLPSLQDFESTSVGQAKTKKEFLLIYEGGISRERGVFEYLAIINSIRAELPNARLTLVGWFGSEDTKAELRSYVEKQGLDDNVAIIEKVPRQEVYEYIKASQIGLDFVVDSYYNPPAHGFPNKIFDYMAYGIPVIYSRNLLKMKKFVVDEGCGLAIEYGDTNGAIAAIKQILAGYDRFSNNCLRAIKVHNWESQEQKLLELYETILTS